MPLSRDRYLTEITRCLSVLRFELTSNNQLGRYNTNKSAEDFFCGLLNLIYDWRLININHKVNNAPGIDLIDTENMIAIQVSSSAEHRKIQNSLFQLIDKYPSMSNCHFYMLVITKKHDKYLKPYETKGVQFNKEKDIWDIDDLLEEISKMPVEKIEKVYDYLQKECEGMYRTNFFVEHKRLYRYLVIGMYVVLIGLIPLFRRVHIIEQLDLLDRFVLFILISVIILELVWKIETDPKVAAKVNSTIHENEILYVSPEQLMAKVIGVFGYNVFISNEQKEGFEDFYRFERMSFGGWEKNRINYLSIDFRHVFEYYDPSVFYLHTMSTRNTAIQILSRQGFILQENNQDSEFIYLKKGNINVFLTTKANGFAKRVVVINCSDEKIRYCLERYVKNDI